MTDLKGLLEMLAKGLTDYPFVVNAIEGEQTTVLELKVSKADMGKVIGKQGRIAKSIRNVMKAVAMHLGKRVQVEIIQSNDDLSSSN